MTPSAFARAFALVSPLCSAHPRPFLLAVPALMAALSAPASVRADQPTSFTFGFDPDPTVVWTKTLSDDQLNDFLGFVPGSHQVTESELTQRYARDDDGNWEVVQHVRRIEMEIDGRRAENPMVNVILGHEIRIQLDEQGRATGATGFRELMRRYERELDPNTYARVRQAMNAESLANGEMAKRNQLMGIVAGRSASIGEHWGVLDRVSVQGGWSPVSGVVHIESWTEIDGQAGVKIVYRYDGSGELYEAASAKITQVMSLRPEDWVAAKNNLGVTGEYTWVVDPMSGQPLYEVFEQVITVPVGKDLEGPRGEMRSAHTWRWTKTEPSAD